MSNFGALTDHFGFLSENFLNLDYSDSGVPIANKAKLISSSDSFIEQNKTSIIDENGNILLTNYYGNTTQNLRNISVTYLLNDIQYFYVWHNTFFLGEKVVNGVNCIIENIVLNFSNNTFPTLSISGKANCLSIENAGYNKFNAFFSDGTFILNNKYAPSIGFTASESLKLSFLTIESSINVNTTIDENGEPIHHGISAGEGTITAEFSKVSSGVSGWTINNPELSNIQSPKQIENQASFHTTNAIAGYDIKRLVELEQDEYRSSPSLGDDNINYTVPVPGGNVIVTNNGDVYGDNSTAFAFLVANPCFAQFALELGPNNIRAFTYRLYTSGPLIELDAEQNYYKIDIGYGFESDTITVRSEALAGGLISGNTSRAQSFLDRCPAFYGFARALGPNNSACFSCA